MRLPVRATPAIAMTASATGATLTAVDSRKGGWLAGRRTERQARLERHAAQDRGRRRAAAHRVSVNQRPPHWRSPTRPARSRVAE